MTNSIYITSAEGNSGKSAIALGLIETLKRAGRRVGIFRPVTRAGTEPDYILELLLTHLGQPDTAGIAVGVSYDDVQTDPEGAMATIVARFNAAASAHDAMVIVGSDYTDVSTPTEFGYNARIAANLGAPVLLVVGGRSPREADRAGAQVFTGLARGPESLFHAAEIALAELNEAHAVPLAVIANRVDPADLANARLALERAVGPERSIPVWVIPEDTVLVAPTLRAIADALDGQLVRGDGALLDREVLDIVVSAMSMEHVLTRLVEDAAVVVPGDRPEVLLAVLMAHQAGTFPNLAGIIVNGGFPVSPIIERLIAGLDGDLPVIETEHTTFETVLRITRTRGKLASESQRKRDLALSLFDRYVDGEQLMQVLDLAVDDVVTPLMFEYRLLEQAALSPKRIVLPEGDDERILRAASTLLQREAAELTILGNEQDVRDKAVRLGIDLSKATVLSPFDPALRDRLAQRYAEMRAHKGITLEAARDIVTDVSYFGTMMVLLGLADGMVSGATHTTAHTIRPAFEVIKTRPGVSIVSSVFLMCLEDRVLVYGDCAVNPNPTAEQLADIAISSSQTARQFGIEPRVAMLSYSTGSSGTGGDVDKVREATAIVRERAPELLVEGPIQYDAAADATVARAKLPDSLVAGQATVFIFPDLNTGNNTYKAVQRSSGAVAIGPVLQGLRKPINDLSRGALVKDIVNTVAITVIQAQAAGESA